jgi:hypothetical protein
MSEWFDTHKGSPQEHGDRCHCGKPAKWHVRWTFGCCHVCGIHKQRLERSALHAKAEAIR